MMWLAALILFQVPSATDVAVQPLIGDTQTGTLVELDSQHVVLQVGGRKLSYDVRDVMELVVPRAEVVRPTDAKIFVQLIDGTRIVGSRYRVANRSAEVQIGTRTVSVETRLIHTVRFHAPSDALDGQWREISNGASQGDVIVLRRSRTALDQLEGIFRDVTDQTVEFEYEDQRIPVKRSKLEGMVYYHGGGRQLPTSVCEVQETGGSSWQAQSITLRDGRLKIVTVAGGECELSWSSIARIDFSSSNVVYLSDLEFELVECTPYVESRVPVDRIMQLYGPRRDCGFEGDGLWLTTGSEVQRFEKGLAIHSRSQLVYRLNEPYRKLTAIVGIDSRLQGRGNLVLVIEGDDRQLIRRDISGRDAPLNLDLDIEGVRRLKILVDFGASLDIADHLNICNARIVK